MDRKDILLSYSGYHAAIVKDIVEDSVIAITKALV